MLYEVAKPDFKILTHSYSPLTDKNGFKQSGKVTSQKYGLIESDADTNLGSWFSHAVAHVLGKTVTHAAALKAGGFVSIQPVKPVDPGVVTTQPVAPQPASGVMRSLPFFNKSVVSGYVPGQPSNPAVLPHFSSNIGDWESDPTLGSMFSKGLKSVSHNPVQALTKVATKIATGGITMITDTGVLGKDAKKIGQRADVVAAGAIGGAVAGAATGGVPGIFAGAVAGGAKGLVDATKTSNPGSDNLTRTLYQGAAYGAAAGGVARAVQAGVSSYQAAQVAKSAETAEQVGYGAAGSTAQAASASEAASSGYGAASTTAAKASSLLANSGSALWTGTKDVAGLLAVKTLLGGGGQNPLVLPGGDGAGSTVPIYIPGSGSQPNTYSGFPGGMTNTALPAIDGGLSPLGNAPAIPATNTIFGLSPTIVYALGGLAAVTLAIRSRRKAA